MHAKGVFRADPAATKSQLVSEAEFDMAEIISVFEPL